MAERYTIDYAGPIRSEADVRAFFRALCAAGCNFHPDDPLSGMVWLDGPDDADGRCFSPTEGRRLDALMNAAHSVAGDAVYTIGMECFKERGWCF